MQLAQEILGGKYEFVLSTHIDKGHVHNHLIFNSVSFEDYRHYHSNKRSYREIRKASDRLCEEYGLSVIVPGKEKGKSYIEHTSTNAGTSYKARLKATIDTLLPGCVELEDLLARLQREGYEVKRDKYIACRASDQERFTRLRTLGVDYAEEALVSRIAGGFWPSKQPKQRDDKIRQLFDLQNNAKARDSVGYAHWAKVSNLKLAAKTLNYLAEHGIDSYEELERRRTEVTEKRNALRSEIKAIEARMTELRLSIKYAETYKSLKPVYEQYKKAKDKEKFLRGHESEIILFEAAEREVKKGVVSPQDLESAKSQLDDVGKKKDGLLLEYRAAGKIRQEHEIVKGNVDVTLNVIDAKTRRGHERK